MKKIEALIRPVKLDSVKAALAQAGITGMTVTPIRGYGRQKGHVETYRGATKAVEFQTKVKLEVILPNEQAEAIATTILEQAKTGKIGDGKLFVMPVDRSVRIRTGEADFSPSADRPES
ncbi:MAG: P-II family nitrogen regulator [Cyanobacteria bacterium J06641_5]